MVHLVDDRDQWRNVVNTVRVCFLTTQSPADTVQLNDVTRLFILCYSYRAQVLVTHRVRPTNAPSLC